MRDAMDVEPIEQFLLRIEDLGVVDAQIGHGLLGAVYLVLHGDAQHDQALAPEVVVHFHHKRRFFLAGTAPGSPEFDQDILALADEVIQGAFFFGKGVVSLELDNG